MGNQAGTGETRTGQEEEQQDQQQEQHQEKEEETHKEEEDEEGGPQQHAIQPARLPSNIQFPCGAPSGDASLQGAGPLSTLAGFPSAAAADP